MSHCYEMICQQVTLSGYAEWPKVADAVIEAIHVLEYLWKAAKAQFDMEDPKAAQWVADKIEQLLHGQVHSIVRNLRRGATLKGMSPKQGEPIDQCATYLANHASYLNYPHYLAQGY